MQDRLQIKYIKCFLAEGRFAWGSVGIRLPLNSCLLVSLARR
jgi:hypothetical protein